MLTHTGAKRSFKHNLRLAVLLSLNAGFINAAGFVAFSTLTTNVTGHAATLAVNLAQSNFEVAKTAAIWLLLFLLGAFFSSFIISKIGREKATAYTLPILVVIFIVLGIAILGKYSIISTYHIKFFTGALLFGMGMQNALVSMISGSVVRTTHLTGMLTDLGIDLSTALFSDREPGATSMLALKLAIIASFLSGGIAGGFAFIQLSFAAFYVPACIMLVALFYEYFRIRIARAVTSRN